MFWKLIAAFAIIYVVQLVLGMRQAKDYTAEFARLRKRGHVALGKRKSLVMSGAIVMFLLDDAGRIVEGSKLTGVTVLSRCRPLNAVNGLLMTEIPDQRPAGMSRTLWDAVLNAREVYKVVHGGGQAVEPLGPFAQAWATIRRIFRRPSAHVA